MRIVNNDYNLDILIESYQVLTLIIESSSAFCDFTMRLCRLEEGVESFLIVSDNDKELRFDKSAIVISDLLHIELNDRKILGKIYEGIEKEMINCNLEQVLHLKNEMEQFMISVCESSEYPLTYNPDSSLQSLFKMYDLRLSSSENDLQVKILDFVRLHHRILGTSFFIFVNLRDFLSDEDAKSLFCTLIYENVYILCIERHDIKKLDIERRYIYDKDCCLIIG